MKNRKKGFTLIELLAVIVIMAVIALIAVPAILNVIEKSKEGAFARSAEGILKSSKLLYSSSLLSSSGASDITLKCTNGECIGTNKNGEEQKLDIEGNVGDGTIEIFENGDIKFTITDGENCAIKYRDETQVVVEDGDCSDADMRLKGKVVLSSSSGTYTYPESNTFEVIQNLGGGTLSCTSSDEEIATCSISGTTVTVNPGTKEGYTELKITAAGNATHKEAYAVYVATTKKGLLSYITNDYKGIYDGDAHGISVSCSGALIKYGLFEGVYDLNENPTYTDVGNYIVYYQIIKAGYVTVEGNRTVTITQADGKIELENFNQTISYDSTKTIEIKENKGNGEVTVTSSNPDVLEAIYEDGKIKIIGKSVGASTIIVTSKETRNYKEASMNYDIVVVQAVNNIGLSSTNGNYTYPDSGTFEITSNPSGGALSCTSSNEEVATCSISGTTVTVNPGTASGNATLTIKSAETKNYLAGQVAYVAVTAKGTLSSITANGYTGVYDGEEHGISVSSSGATIKFGTTNDTYDLDKSPTYTNVGTYTIYYQVSKAGYNTVTGSKQVEITKANGTVTAPTAKNLTYTGTAQALINAGSSNTGTIEYKLEGGSYSENIPTAIKDGTYKVYYRVIGDENHKDVTEASISVSIAKAKLNYMASGYTGIYDGEAHGISVASSGATIKFGTTNGTYDLDKNPTYTDVGEYTVYYQITREGYVTVEGSEKVTITKSENIIKLSSTNGNYTYPDSGTFEIASNPSGGILSCTSSNENVATCSISGTTVTVNPGTASGNATLTIKSAETKNYLAGQVAYVAVTAKGTLSSITANGYTGVYDGEEHGITVTSNIIGATIKYSETENGEYTEINPTYTNVGTYTVYYQVSKAGYNTVTGSKQVEITKANGTVTAPTAKNLTYTGTAQALINAGSSNTGTIEYKLEGGSYSENIPTATNHGTYKVYYRVIGDENHKDVTEASISVSIAKADGKVTAPTAKNLTYTGTAQTLINAGSSNTGTIEYKLDGGSYSENIPTAINHGTYKVYYRVIGDENHKDVTEASISVSIAKANNTLTLSSGGASYKYPTAGTFAITKNTSGGALSCISSNENIATCSISETTVTVTPGTTEGNATITITSEATDNYNAGQAAHAVTTKSGTLNNITANGYTGEYDGKAHGITVTCSEATIKYSETSSGSFTLNASPIYTDVGTYTVYYQVSKAGYATVTGSKQVVITQAPNSLALSDTNGNYTYPSTGTFTITKNTSGGALSCASSNESIATCSISGTTVTVTPGTTEGNATITVTSAETTNYKAETINHTAAVANGTLIVNASGYSGTYDGTAHGISVTSSGATIKYGTSNGTYNLPSSPTYIDAGTYTVYYQVSRTGYKTVTSSKQVIISKAENTLELSSTSGSYTYPTAGTFTINKNISGGTLSCTSSNTAVATCSISGTTVTVTPGTGEGTSTITITSAETTNYNLKQVAYTATTKNGLITVTANGYTGEYDGKAHGISVSTNLAGATIKYGTSSGSYTLNSSPTYTAVGTHTVYYQVSKAGYTTVTGSKQVIIKDTTLPTVSYNLSTGYYNAAKTIRITPSDANYSYMMVHVYKNGSKVAAKSTDKTTATYYDVALDSVGTWIVYTQAYDTSGNKQSQSPDNGGGWYYQQYVIDTTLPTVSYNLAGGVFSSTKTVRVTGSDANYSHMYVHVYKDGAIQSISNAANPTSSTYYDVPLNSNGNWVIYTQVYDKAGNKHSKSPDNGGGWYYQSYTIDTTKPSAGMSVIYNGSTIGNNGRIRGTATVRASCSTGPSGVSQYTLQIRDGVYSTVLGTLTSKTTDISFNPNNYKTTNGKYQLVVSCTSGAGLQSSTVSQYVNYY